MSNYYNAQWKFIGEYLLVQGQSGATVLTPEQVKRLARELYQRHDGTLGADEPQPPLPHGLHADSGHFDVV